MTKLGMFMVVTMALAATVGADVPRMINYQGRLTHTSGQPMDTTTSITFTIYDDSTGGVALWTETHLSVTVEDGLFSVILGTAAPIDDSVFAGADRWLGIMPGSEPEIQPRTKFVTVPYAFRVSTVDGASGGTVEGDINIERDVIITGDTIYVGEIQIEPTTRYYSVPPGVFSGSGTYYQSPEGRDSVFFSNPYRPPIISAPLHVPQGAVVAKAVAYVQSEGLGDAYFELWLKRTPAAATDSQPGGLWVDPAWW